METQSLALLKQLIACPSLTPHDAGCQALLAEHLIPLGFTLEHYPQDGVSNLFARLGTQSPVFLFAGHTDVVPTGPLEDWHSDPFTATERQGRIYGRGAADMKGSLAAFITALEIFLKHTPHPQGSIALLITSDEEGPALSGTRYVLERLKQQNIHIDYCLIGEPSSHTRVGDTLKNGRRGSLSGMLQIQGIQGHVAYPAQANNAIHLALPILDTLTQTIWDQGTVDFPPTTFQIVNIQAGTGTPNVIPGIIDIEFNLRYSTAHTDTDLQCFIEQILKTAAVEYTLHWKHSGDPFITPAGEWTQWIQEAVFSVMQITPELKTDGGTSDGRFIRPQLQCPVVELGPVNASIHKIDESIGIEEVYQLTNIYEAILHRIFQKEDLSKNAPSNPNT